MNSKPFWLDRCLMVSAYHYCLCLSEQELKDKLVELKVDPFNMPSDFVGKMNGAKLHHFIAPDGEYVAIVCMDLETSLTKTPCQVAALLVHEAVHIWQKHAVYISSFNDHGDEDEAYAIQNISQSLLEEYSRRLKEHYEQT